MRLDYPELKPAGPVDPEYERQLDTFLAYVDPEVLEFRVRRALRRIFAAGAYQPHWTNDAELRALAKAIHLCLPPVAPAPATGFDAPESTGDVASEPAGHSAEAIGRTPMVNEWRMCQTEVCLRLALYLAAQEMVTSDIVVALSGREVTRKWKRPRFHVRAFLEAHGAVAEDVRRDGLGRYVTAQGAGVRVVLDTGAGDVVATIGPGSRLVVHAAPGPTRDTKGSIEYAVLRSAIGAAMTRHDITPDDILAVAVPRSTRMRRVVAEARIAPLIVTARLCLVLVGTSNEVDGLPLLKKYEAEPWGEADNQQIAENTRLEG